MIGKIITFVNVKGGSGKTTSVINVGECLSLKGYRVLLIDTDPLSSLTSAVLSGEVKGNSSLTNIMNENRSANEVIVNQLKCDILPSDLSLSAADNNFEVVEKNINLLDHALKDLNYDFILIDTSSSLGKMTRNAIYAADYILIPIQADGFNMTEFDKMLEVYNKMKRKANSRMKILGIFVANKHHGINLPIEVKTMANMTFGKKMMKTYIRHDLKVSESKDPSSIGTIDYRNLTSEILQKI
ncbi:MAG: ParA family protein [Spirochaetaceae bacterium]|jgi:chromosome partitioning protein|nr:ParA family protein [Spirochaetaceae bacterium]